MNLPPPAKRGRATGSRKMAKICYRGVGSGGKWAKMHCKLGQNSRGAAFHVWGGNCKLPPTKYCKFSCFIEICICRIIQYYCTNHTQHTNPLPPPLPSLNCFANFPCNFAQQKDNSLLYKRRNFQKVDAYSILSNTKRNNRLMLVWIWIYWSTRKSINFGYFFLKSVNIYVDY